MCLTLPARIIAVDQGEAVVEIDGQRRRAKTRFVPDVTPGEHVLVGLGVVLARLSADEAKRLAADLEILTGPRRPTQPTGG